MKRYLLGMDFGTSGVKCLVFDPETGDGTDAYSAWHTQMRRPGFSEIDTNVMWCGFLDGVSTALQRAGIHASQIAGIGCCALCPGLIAIGDSGHTLTGAITYQDMRSAKQACDIAEAFGEDEGFSVVGNRLMSGSSSVTTMRWLKEHQPEVVGQTRRFLHIPSWFGMRLTGRIAMDWSQAAGTGLFDIHSRVWSADLARRAGIDATMLPALTCGSALLGGLNNRELLEMGFVDGTPVAVGGGDTACTALALNAVEHGSMFLSMGTSSVITVCSQRDSFDDRLINRCHIIPDRWIKTGAMSTTGGALRWFRDSFCQDFVRAEAVGGQDAYCAIDRMVETESTPCSELLFLPYMNGERCPVFDPNVRGVFLGVGLDTTRADFARAIMESAGFGIRQLLDIAADGVSDIAGDGLVTVGGGSGSSVWCKIIADITGVCLKTVRLANSGAVGAAVLGGMAAGLIPPGYRVSNAVQSVVAPDKDRAAIYQAKYRRYLEMYPACSPMFAEGLSDD